MIHKVHVAAMASALAGLLMASASAAETFELDSTKGLQAHDVTVEAVAYRDRKAVRVMPAAAADPELVAPKNGETIEVDVAGKPRAGAPSDARGFMGLPGNRGAIQVRMRLYSPYQWSYRRPSTAESLDAIRLHAGVRMVKAAEGSTGTVRVLCGFVTGRVDEDQDRSDRSEGALVRQRFHTARAGSKRLKHGDSEGAVALWIGLGTEGYFANLRLSK